MINFKDNRIINADLAYISGANLPWHLLKNKTVVIAGASGFLPSYLVWTLLFLNKTKNLNIKVIGLVRNIKKAKQKFYDYAGDKHLHLIHCDVCDKVKVSGRVDYIIHAASNATPKVFKKNPVGIVASNVIGTANLLKLAVEKKVKGFLFFSTTGVYGHLKPKEYPAKESVFGSLDPTKQSSCYNESKRMGENMCVAWMHQYKVPIKIVRPAITYGPGVSLNDGRSFADFISNIVNNQNIRLYSKGKVIRNFCYIADATTGFFTVLFNGQIGEAYNVATNVDISIVGLAKKLVSEIFPERKLKVIFKKDSSRNYLRMDFLRTTPDIRKLKSLGWTLKFPLKEGFTRTVASFEECKFKRGPDVVRGKK